MAAEAVPPYIVGIGASAGGLEALEELFAATPPDIEAAFVVVQHLSPDFESVMDELLARRTRLPVMRVTNDMPVEPGRVYLIPPRKEMIVSDGRLLLSEQVRDGELSLPIDVFFRSLARDAGQRAIAVVLSGTGSDGSRGVRAVHDAGGLVLVQRPESAGFDGMPKNAQDTGVADLMVLPGDVAMAVERYIRQGSPDAASGPDEETREGALRHVLDLLHRHYGIDFGHYKPATVQRRIERRLLLHRDVDLVTYARGLAEETQELDALYRDLLIGVTHFFRDPDAYARLERDVLPTLLDGLGPSHELRVWVPGCATGEEPYSLAILLHELCDERRRAPSVKIFATDVHRRSLDFASAAIYSEAALDGISEARRARYFSQGPDGFRIASEIRQMVVFAPHNLVRDAPFTRLDLISCRNLLIYLLPEAQRKVLALFHFGLKTGGVLLLGPSESVGTLGDELETLDDRWKLYRKERDVRLPAGARLPLGGRSAALSSADARTQRRTMSHLLQSYDVLLDRYMPASLLVNESHELLHAFGGASKYLVPRDGRPSQVVLDMLPPDLRMPVMGALQRVRKDGEPVIYRGVPSKVTGERLDVRVEPVESEENGELQMLITFEPDVREVRLPAAVAPERQLDIADVSQTQLRQLEEELTHTRENLHATIEELETSNEELQAANEELVASNEELQSTNEELQSVNEELYTVNAEFQKKIQELTVLTNDMDNLLSSTDVGTIFLDAELRIRKITPGIARSFSLQPQDIGRQIEDFTHSIEHPGLLADLKGVLADAVPREKEVQDGSGRWYFLRVLPYRSAVGVEGVVLTLIDIGAIKRAERELYQARYLLDSLMDTLPDEVWFCDDRGRFVRLNTALAGRLGLAHPRQAIGARMSELRPTDRSRRWEAREQATRRTGARVINELEMLEGPDGETAWALTTQLPLHDEEGKVVGTFGVSRDITRQKSAEDAANLAVRRRDQFLAILSHELRNPLAAVVNGLAVVGPTIDPPQREHFEVMERQVHQMSRLLGDLLDVSRIAQDKIELQREVVDLASVARDSVASMRALAGAAEIRIDSELDPDVRVLGDPARLRQVLANLLSNAIKYNSPGGSVCVTVARDGRSAVVGVKDDGVGIDGKVVAQIFDMFVQADESLSRSDGGMGLGLALVRGIVSLHGGEVSARSDGPGRGTDVIVTLPVTDEPTRPVVARAGAEGGRGQTVVLVEDQQDNRSVLRILLERRGYRVVEAADGEAGERAVLAHQPAVAIVDIGLPKLDGYELARRIRADARGNGVRLVALTGYGTAADRQRALDAGFDVHVVKPVEPEALVEILASPVELPDD